MSLWSVWRGFGYDPTIEGFDQKPVHFNESGSRMQETLGWTRSHDVSLKECTTQTREMWTLMTPVASDWARFPECPPFEALFAGGVRVEGRLKVVLTDICAGDYVLLRPSVRKERTDKSRSCNTYDDN